MTAQPECLPVDYGGPVDRPFESFPYAALEGSVIDRFDAVVRRFPTRLAVQDSARKLTYTELSAMANDIAAAVTRVTSGRAGPVAIVLRCEARFPAAMLGVLAAGRGYVPLDADQPIARNQLIAAEAGAAAVLSAGGLADHVRTLFPPSVPVIDLDRSERAPGGDPRPAIAPDDLAYVIYTSGSTGTPKGIYQNHRGLLHDVLQFTNALHLDPEDRLSLAYSPSVIGAIRDVYGALLNGASTHVLPPRQLGPAGLVREIRARGITILHAVPVLFRRVVEALGPGETLDGVRVVYLASDRITWGDAVGFRRAVRPGVSLYVTWGQTECTTVHSHWFVDEAARAHGEGFPAGRPVPDRTVTIVDLAGQPVADGEVGEVVVTSRYIALGYWRAPERTRLAFPTDPADPAARVFRTGDLGRRRSDGLVEFVGRRDLQIKLRGHRIEPAEVEHAIAKRPEVADAAVLVRRSATGIPRSLVAYVVLSPGGRGMLPRHLTALLERSLPRYMVPSSIIVVKELPRLPNLKIDRSTLARIDASRGSDVSDRAADLMVDEVAKVFEAVLGVDGATGDDNVASLGGDSLQVQNLVTELERRFSIVIADDLMETTPTIRDLARWIAAQRLAAEQQDAYEREPGTS